MKILIVGDEELSLPYQFFTPEEFPGIDLILSSGDIEPEHLSFLAEKFKKPLFYVRGNHDTAYTFRPPKGCRNIDAQVAVFRGIRILGLEGSIWYGGKGVEYTEKQMRRKIRKLSFLIWLKGGVDIVLTHSSPKGIHEGGDPCHQGFKSFQELIFKYKPLYFIHGHVGCSGYGKERRVDLIDKTKVVNSCGYYILETNFEERRKKKLFQRKKKSLLKCFDEESQKQNLLYQVDKGIKMVEISKIVGSVGRSVDFNIDFRPQRENTQERLNSAKFALKLGISLPPIELYKVKDEYYVVDGHHRVAAAKELGKKYLKAHIIEYLPPKDSLENILYYAKLDFEYETGLEKVNFSRPAEYKKAISQIRNHYFYLKKNKDKKITFKEAAYYWFYDIYQPLIRKIEKEKLVNQFKNVTSGDIYLYISEQLQIRNRKRDYYISLSEALKEASLLREETRLLTSSEDFKEKIKKFLFPYLYLEKYPYLQKLGRKKFVSSLKKFF